MIYVAGPGPWRPGAGGQHLPRGQLQRDLSRTSARTRPACRSCSSSSRFPAGSPATSRRRRPGSIHEGGELGYSLSHAFGAAFDNPDLIVACVVGDGEAETGPLATAWHSNKLLEPGHRRCRAADPAPQRLQDQQPDRPRAHRARGARAVLPRLRLDVRTSSRATSRRRCTSSWPPRSTRPSRRSGESRTDARDRRDPARPRWPMIVLRSPKGWTGPKVVDGLQIEGTFRSHQVPLLVDAAHPDHVAHARELDAELPARGAVRRRRPAASPELAELAPKGDRRMGANPHANGGVLLRDLRMPDFREHAVDVPAPGAVDGQDTLVLGRFLRDVVKLQRGAAQLPRLRPGRDAVEPARRGLRGDQPPVGGARGRRTTNSSPPPAACWTRCSASISARAGWRAIC